MANGHARYRCPDGTYVRSQYERSVLLRAPLPGITYEPFSVPYEVVVRAKYTPDFVLTPSGVWVECKGYFRKEDRVKMRRIREAHPHQPIALLFQKDQPLTKGGKLTYTGWAHKYGFLWHVGEVIPHQWYTLNAHDTH